MRTVNLNGLCQQNLKAEFFIGMLVSTIKIGLYLLPIARSHVKWAPRYKCV